MRLFLFSTSKSIWCRLLKPRNQIASAQDHVGSVSNFRYLDLVQSRIRRRLANRSWSSFAGANRCTLFYPGPVIPVCCRRVLCPGFWESHRVTHHIAHLPLFVLARSQPRRCVAAPRG